MARNSGKRLTMNASKDEPEDGGKLLADAAMRTCLFDFEAARNLCLRVLALEEGTQRQAAQVLLQAIEHNRTCYLYDVAVERQASRDAKPAAPSIFAYCRRLVEKSIRRAGSFDVHFDNTGMVVSGALLDASPVVHVFINELLVASVPTAPETRRFRSGRTFWFRIGSGSLSLLPASHNARLALSTGDRMLRHAGGETFYRCSWPGGKGGIEDAILKGAVLTGHHRIRSPAAPATVDGWLDVYETVAGSMNAAWGKPLFLYYGSLLGAVRENRIIPYDDDFDVAYLSDQTSPDEVKEEMIAIIAGLAAAHPDMVIRLVNFFFKVRHKGSHIDVFPAWHDGESLWSPWATRLECEDNPLRQLVEREFHGRRVLVPAQAETFLRLKYGENWRTPDPSYRVQALPREAYPFRRMPFGAEDRTRIIEAAREIAGDAPVATVKLMKE
jgi:hypothetical protein